MRSGRRGKDVATGLRLHTTKELSPSTVANILSQALPLQASHEDVPSARCSGSFVPMLVHTAEVEGLKGKLETCEELIKQLKGIVAAQHSKIEELRDRVEYTSVFGMQEMLEKQGKDVMMNMKTENEAYRQQVHTLKAEMLKVKKDNDTLRKANKRLKAILHHDPTTESLKDSSPAPVARLPSSPSPISTAQALPPAFGASWGVGGVCVNPGSSSPQRPSTVPATFVAVAGLSRSAPDAGGAGGVGGGDSELVSMLQANLSGTERSRRSPRFFEHETSKDGLSMSCCASVCCGELDASLTHRPSVSSTWGKGFRNSVLGGTVGFSRLSRLLSILPTLYKDLEAPLKVLRALGDLSVRLLQDFPTVTVTVYVLDTWLRSEVSEEADSQSPTVYYLGQGKLQLQVLSSTGRGRPEPPTFSSTQALPYFTRSCIAAAVQFKDRQFAIVQAQLRGEDQDLEGSDKETRAMPKILQRAGTTGAAMPDHSAPEKPVGFPETAKDFLHLACTVAAGLIAQTERMRIRQRQLDRFRACLDIAAEVNKAHSILDFEQRVRHLFGMFFNVSSVRLLFYYEEKQSLVVSPQVSRQEPAFYALSKGIIGMVAKKKEVMHITNAATNPYVDHYADGMQRAGRPVAANAAMLVGPLLVDQAVDGEKSRLLGVVQIMERRTRVPPAQSGANGVFGPPPTGEFTAEEQSLFAQLSRIVAVVMWRTWKMQEQAARIDGVAYTLPRLLAAK